MRQLTSERKSTSELTAQLTSTGTQSSSTDLWSTEAVDALAIAGIRLVFALSFLLILWLDPLKPEQQASFTDATLVLYALLSAGIFLLVSRRHPWHVVICYWAHWSDVAWFTLLIALSGGANSIFFPAFFFPVMVASFRWGLLPGLQVTVSTLLLFITVSVATAPPATEFELNRFLLRSTFLLVLGYTIAYWGGSVVDYKRRLTLLKQVTLLSNPRLGVDRTAATLVERLHNFYQTDSCLLVLVEPEQDKSPEPDELGKDEPHQPRLFCAERSTSQRSNSTPAAVSSTLPLVMADRLLGLPTQQAVLYANPSPRWWPFRPSVTRSLQCEVYAVVQSKPVAPDQASMQANIRTNITAIAELFAAGALASVPLLSQGRLLGRLFLIRRRALPFKQADLDFILQISECVVPVIENIRLVDRLASDAAETERRRLAHNIHDSVLQSHLGLQAGLQGLAHKVEAGLDVSADVQRLISMTALGAADLRSYVEGARVPGEHGGLGPAVRRFVTKFAEATDIRVRLELQDDLVVGDRLAGEVFQIVAEGLSNIRRHTEATHATVELRCHEHNLLLRIENECRGGVPPAPFTPKSISERVAALGGQARVEQREAESAVAVLVEVPL